LRRRLPIKNGYPIFTYIWTEEGWLYLAVVLELYSRRVIGWAIAERMTVTLVCDALTMALWRHHLPKGVIVHSDRGSQYCSAAYQILLKKHQLICSMSKKGDCYYNAAMESWYHSLKVEAVHGERFMTRAEAKQQVFDYIEVYYNRKRLHSKLGYLSPEAFELKNVAQQCVCEKRARSMGYRNRLHYSNLPGKPEFWKKKLADNQSRDSRNIIDLKKLGWNALVIWECRIGDLQSLAENLHSYLQAKNE